MNAMQKKLLFCDCKETDSAKNKEELVALKRLGERETKVEQILLVKNWVNKMFLWFEANFQPSYRKC